MWARSSRSTLLPTARDYLLRGSEVCKGRFGTGASEGQFGDRPGKVLDLGFGSGVDGVVVVLGPTGPVFSVRFHSQVALPGTGRDRSRQEKVTGCRDQILGVGRTLSFVVPRVVGPNLGSQPRALTSDA